MFDGAGGQRRTTRLDIQRCLPADTPSSDRCSLSRHLLIGALFFLLVAPLSLDVLRPAEVDEVFNVRFPLFFADANICSLFVFTATVTGPQHCVWLLRHRAWKSVTVERNMTPVSVGSVGLVRIYVPRFISCPGCMLCCFHCE